MLNIFPFQFDIEERELSTFKKRPSDSHQCRSRKPEKEN